MFTRFTCRGYRNVTADDVELGPLTVLLGPNNCGKSNFVRALTFVSDLCDVLDGVAWARPVDRVIQEHGAHRLLRRGQPAESPHATLQWTCRRGAPGDVAAINSAGYEIGIGPRFRALPQPARNDATAPLLQTEKLHLSVVSGPTSWTREGATLEMAVYDADGVQAYSEEYRDRESFLVQPVGRAVGGDHGKLLSSPADRLARFYGPVGRFECARFDPHEVAQPVRRERNVRLDAQARQLANILADRDNEADGLEAIVARMQELVPDLERLWVPDDANSGAFRSVRAKQRGAVFDLVELSDGTVHALVLATLLTGPRQYGVLCLDQPELNLHPAWLRVLGNWLQRQEGADQVIVTTHAPDLLDTLTAGFRQGDVTVLVFDVDGNVRNVDPAELDDRFAEGWELGDLYRVGGSAARRVALVKIGWFATGGHTEVGGLPRFLQRIDDRTRWVRCFPAVQKPGPKLGRAAPAPSDEGITGADLGARMLKLIRERHQPGEFDAYLLVDDADCRFCGDEPTAARAAFTERLALEVAQHLGRDVPVVVLLASPEIEAWFVADWSRGFRATYPRHADALGRAVNRLLKAHDLDRDRIEAFGCPRAGASCTTKLSDEIIALVEARGGRYSKGIDGPSMLKRIDPTRVARRCRRDFAPALAELRRVMTAHAAAN